MRASRFPHPEEPLRELWLPLCPQAYLYVCRRPCRLCVRSRVPGREALRGRCSGPSAWTCPSAVCHRAGMGAGSDGRFFSAFHCASSVCSVGESRGVTGVWGGLGPLVLACVLFGEVCTCHGGDADAAVSQRASALSTLAFILMVRVAIVLVIPFFLPGDSRCRACHLCSRPRPQSTGR